VLLPQLYTFLSSCHHWHHIHSTTDRSNSSICSKYCGNLQVDHYSHLLLNNSRLVTLHKFDKVFSGYQPHQVYVVYQRFDVHLGHHHQGYVYIEMSVDYVHLMRLIAREDFIKFTRCESTKTFINLLNWKYKSRIFLFLCFVSRSLIFLSDILSFVLKSSAGFISYIVQIISICLTWILQPVHFSLLPLV
jgi:hypothetical protein